jgi:hypothetical protein
MNKGSVTRSRVESLRAPSATAEQSVELGKGAKEPDHNAIRFTAEFTASLTLVSPVRPCRKCSPCCFNSLLFVQEERPHQVVNYRANIHTTVFAVSTLSQHKAASIPGVTICSCTWSHMPMSRCCGEVPAAESSARRHCGYIFRFWRVPALATSEVFQNCDFWLWLIM